MPIRFARKFLSICAVLLGCLLPISAGALMLVPERASVAPGEEVRVRVVEGRTTADAVWRSSRHLEMLAQEPGLARFQAREEGRALVTVTVDGELASVFIAVTGGAADPSPTTSPGHTAGRQDPVTPAKPAAPDKVLFDGSLSSAWNEVGVSGGDFAQFARLESGALVVDVPEGHHWAKTGIRSPEPVVFPRNDGDATLLRFTFDTARTSSFVIALAESDAADEWGAHDIRFGWSRSPKAGDGSARLYLRRTEVRAVETNPEAPGVVELRLDPSGVVEVALPDGKILEASLPDRLAAGGYRIHVVAHAPGQNNAAQMALKRIEREAVAARAVLLRPYPDPRAEIVLFDGRLGTLWTPHSAAGGDFGRDARIDGKMLSVDVAEGNGGGKVGILSGEPVVWLDQFRGDAQVSVTFEIDPQRSEGFALALAYPGYGGVPGNDPGTPNVTYYFYKPKDSPTARADVHFYPHREGDFVKQDVAPIPPGDVRFVLRPGEATVQAEGMEPVTRAWDKAVDGNGLRIYAYSVVPEGNAPTRFALKSIRLDRKSGPAAQTARPAAGVLPLPVETVFDGSMSPAWGSISVAGGNFDAFARFEGGALRVDVPEKHSWGKTGLLSAEPLIRLDDRVNRTPARMELILDPAVRQNLNVALSSRKIADMWQHHSAWYTFSYLPYRDRWVMGIRSSPYQAWSCEIDPAWMAEHWDGQLRIDIGVGWTELSIPGGPKVRADINSGAYYDFHATVVAHAPKEHAPATLALKRITLGYVTPDGMNATDRWQLLSKEEFDANGFLEDLAASTPFATTVIQDDRK
jgi:hypothetical protein